jgi:hypothetical protein
MVTHKGNRRIKVLPQPNSLRVVRLPRWARAMVWAIANPSPDPPVWRDRYILGRSDRKFAVVRSPQSRYQRKKGRVYEIIYFRQLFSYYCLYQFLRHCFICSISCFCEAKISWDNFFISGRLDFFKASSAITKAPSWWGIIAFKKRKSN